MTYIIETIWEPNIKGMGDIVRYGQGPNYDPATLHEKLKKLKLNLHLHSPEIKLAEFHTVLIHHPDEL